MKRPGSVYLPLAGLAWLLVAAAALPLRADPATPTPTSTPWYRVELVVFARLSPHAGSHETWPANPGVPDFSHSVALVPAQGSAGADSGDGAVVTPLGPIPYQELPTSKAGMSGVVKVLNGSGRYRVLLHIAWRQPADAPRSARPVRVQLPDGVLEGTVRLTHSRYLHVALDLLYRPAGGPLDAAASTGDAVTGSAAAAAPAANGTASSPAYRMRQHRRIDPGVLNYFDHPLFGVLIKTSPIDVEPADTPSSPGTPAPSSSPSGGNS